MQMLRKRPPAEEFLERSGVAFLSQVVPNPESIFGACSRGIAMPASDMQL